MIYNDLFTDWATDKLDELMTDEIQPFFGNYHKLNLYNFGKNTPLQKLWLRVPKMKVVQSTFQPDKKKSKGFLMLNLYVHQQDPDAKKFYFFIRRLEKAVKNILGKDYDLKNMKLKSCLKKLKENYTTFTVRLPYSVIQDQIVFDFDIYNLKNKKIMQNSIVSGQYAMSIVELSEIWINDNEFSFNFNVVQMKIIPDFDFNKCLFTDSDTDTDTDNEHDSDSCCEVKLNVPKAPQQTPPHLPKSNKVISNQHHFAPTIDDLKNIKLRPIIRR
jgi:hypothetical protein